MKVKELIEKLQTFDPEMHLIVDTTLQDDQYIREVIEGGDSYGNEVIIIKCKK